MKGFLIDMMTMMMPAMKPLVWLAVLGFVLAAVLALVGHVTWARRAAAVMLGIGVFFLIAQGMGALLGAAPSINFGDARKFEFVLVPFWQLGLACVIGWLLLRGLFGIVSRRGPEEA